jgi:hypothetical protein
MEKLARRDAELRHEAGDQTWDKLERFVRYAWACGAVVAAVTLWTAKVQWELASLVKEVALHDKRVEQLVDQRNGNTLLIQTIQTSIENNRVERVAALKELHTMVARQQTLWDAWLPKIDEMNSMKDFGISNKERFFQKNRYAAPALPGVPADPE